MLRAIYEYMDISYMDIIIYISYIYMCSNHNHNNVNIVILKNIGII